MRGEFVPEGDWEDVPGGQIRYLRGDGEGALEVRFPPFKPGMSIRVLPDGEHSGRARRYLVQRAMGHVADTTRLRRLNSDDIGLWLIGFLWTRGFREVELHIDPSHRI